MKLALIVNDVASLNVDAGLALGSGASHKSMRQLQGGCICCTLREDLLEQIQELATSELYDALVIEATGLAEPLPIAEAFTFSPLNQAHLPPLQAHARLDSMVCVVDLSAWDQCMDSPDYSALFLQQIEFASVAIANKADLVSEAQAAAVCDKLKQLNPGAQIITATFGRVPLHAVVNARSFDMDAATGHPQWLSEPRYVRGNVRGHQLCARAFPVSPHPSPAPPNHLSGTHIPETEEYGITTGIVQAARPLLASKFWSLCRDLAADPDLLRVKGWVWLLERPAARVVWQIAGMHSHVECAGRWLAESHPSSWPSAWVHMLLGEWHPVYGDRRCDVVLIGSVGAVQRATAAIEDAFAQSTDWDPATGQELTPHADPLPAWDLPAVVPSAGVLPAAMVRHINASWLAARAPVS